MSWAKLCDNVDIDPDLLELHPDAFAFFIGTITYSARNLTDGFIKRCHAPDILRFKGKRKINVSRAITALVKGRFLTEEAGGWRVRNYLKFNPSCAQVNAKAAIASERARAVPLRQAVLTRDQGICRYCGCVPASPHLDHVQPVSRGGLSTLENLVVACGPCNLAKGSKEVF